MHRRRAVLAALIAVAAFSAWWLWPRPVGRYPRGYSPPPEFAKIADDWSAANERYEHALLQTKGNVQRQKLQAEQTPKPEVFVERCLKLAEDLPGTREEFAALLLAFDLTQEEKQARSIAARLTAERLAGVTLDDIYVHFQDLKSDASKPGMAELAGAVLRRVQPDLERADPTALRVLARVCIRTADRRSVEVPPYFTEAAQLVIDRFADRPEIANFCESLHGISGDGPSWAIQYEPHLRIILEKNQHRFVRALAWHALAGVIAGTGPARAAEAEAVYREIVAEFDGRRDLGAEQFVLDHAKRMLAVLGARGPGKLAPEIVGEDTDGHPMKLSDFRGMVVLLDFWGFW